MIAKLLQLGLGAALVLAILCGGPAVWWYDRHFAGWSWGVRVPFTHCCKVGLSPGLAVRDTAAITTWRAAAAAAVTDAHRLMAALDDQTARVRAVSAAGAAALAKAETATADYRRAAAKAEVAEAAVIALGRPTPRTQDPCRRAEAVDNAFVRGLP